MKKILLIATTSLTLLAGSAYANDETPPPPPPHGGPAHMDGDYVPYEQLTLEKAREHAHKRAEKLDKMTPEEWDAHKKKVMERREKWKSMTPDQREKFKDEMRAKRHNGGADAAGGKTEPAGK